jgi:DNA invertase Pin-like site-specific DNA recombinase
VQVRPGGGLVRRSAGPVAATPGRFPQERVKAGLARAKAKGKVLGRRPVGAEIEAKIVELRATGAGIIKIAKTLGIGVSVVQRVVATA